jgi:Immunoglobulin I-set domain
MHKPEFIKGLKDMTINDTEMLTLQCSVKGDPDPQITWSKNGKKISSSEIIDLKYKSGVATLKINEVFPEDEGEYTCTATNSVGSTDSKCQLKVKRKFWKCK